MSEPIEEAKKRLAWHMQRAKELEDFLRLYEDLSSMNAEHGDIWEREPEETKEPVEKPVERRRMSTRGGATPREIAEIMRRVIRERGQPMTRGEIVEALEARDVDLPAADKGRYIGTIAWRHKAFFKHIEGRGYWVTGDAEKDWWRRSVRAGAI